MFDLQKYVLHFLKTNVCLAFFLYPRKAQLDYCQAILFTSDCNYPPSDQWQNGVKLVKKD